MELNHYNVHGMNIKRKLEKENHPKILEEIFEKYKVWRELTETIKGGSIKSIIREKVRLLNDYKNYIDTVKRYFKPQDRLASSVIEEFLY